MNLIPDKPGCTPNYFCTWGCQNVFASRKHPPESVVGGQGAQNARMELNAELLFAVDGLCDEYPEIRQDLYFLLDDGWDVPYGTHPVSRFGSVIPDAGRFHCCTGSPIEKLTQINRMIQAKGWRGVGLWIASQACGESKDRHLAPDELREYWRNRMLWSKAAGIKLWKVDWGYRAMQNDFRLMLSETGRECNPELIIEHSIPSAPFNSIVVHNNQLSGTGRFEDERELLSQIKSILPFSGLVRIYDMLPPLTTATALDRTLFFLRHGAGAMINVEDEVVVGAVLGCAFGIMRSPQIISDTVWGRPDEADAIVNVIRAVRWQRLVPAWKTNISEQIEASSERLTDSWTFAENSTWMAAVFKQTVSQSAPAVISRNLPLPEIIRHEKDAPFVIASRSPEGALAFGILPRRIPGRCFTPAITLVCGSDVQGCPIAVFGKFTALSLPLPAAGFRLWGQDLAAEEAIDLTAMTTTEEKRLIIPGRCVEALHLRSSETSMPGDGIILRIESD